eukprot:TRINITY_DN15598_c0_g1_i1.p1 TRINITY_DN15598_c0_g1~~TRINITY_DN15598_c0_g1_i1.p1  ORF type:complete len:298 (+),score=65.15 TRINITY_DN15598_c0_g1_i1:40-933(+)
MCIRDRVATLGLVTAAIGGIALVGSSSLYTVPAGHRALIFQKLGPGKGVKPAVIGEGTHFRIPILQEPIYFDTRVTPKVIRSETGSKDLQTIQVHVRLLYRPQIDRLHSIFTKIGLNYDEQVLPSIGTEILKAVIAGFNAEELVTQRENVSALIRSALLKRADEFGIALDDVSLVHLAFSREFTQAIETKQVAQQMAERQKFLVEKSRHETQAEVILAEGETEAADLIADAMKSGRAFLELRKIEAAKEIAQTLSQSPNVIYLPSSGNVLMNLNRPTNPQPQRVLVENSQNYDNQRL